MPAVFAMRLRVKLVRRPGWSLLLCLLELLAGASLSAADWQSGAGCRFQALEIASGGKAGFSLLPPQTTGIEFTNVLPLSRSLTNTILPNGSGVAAGDIDADGWCDLFFCGLGGGSKLYRNLGGWKFEDITARAGVACENLDATGTVFADLDGNGSLDLLVSSIAGGTHVFFNDGKGYFTRGSQVLNPGKGGTSLALADADGDGRLDLYHANYRASTIMDMPGTRFNMRMVNGQPEVASINGRPLTDPEWTNRFRFTITRDGRTGRLGREELGEADLFCRNDGKGRFEPVPWVGGAFLDEEGHPLAEPPFDWGLSVAFRDFNGDGSPDLYVCNDFRTPDRFWLNDGHGRFRAAPWPALRQTSFSSMGVDVADLNRDGLDDFMVVEMLSRDHQRRMVQRNSMNAEAGGSGREGSRPQHTRNTLFLNRGDGTYAEIAQYAGVDASEWSWMPVFLDVDLDGYEDLLVPNGFERDNMNVDVQNQINRANAANRGALPAEALALRKMFPRLATPNLAFRNRGDLRFQEVSREWGFDTPVISQGMCLADLDNDGDLDVVVNNLNDGAGLYRNNSAAPRIAVRLRGLAPNTRGIGARITLTGGPVAQGQEMVCGGRYLSADEAVRVFAAAKPGGPLRLEVVWRNGKRSLINQVQANHLYEVDEAAAQLPPVKTAPRPPAPIFEDVSPLLTHIHHEEVFDDFQRQPLLPKRFSQPGPGIGWWDMNGDGWEDLVIGSGKGGIPACYLNDGKGRFAKASQTPWDRLASRDQAAVAGWGSGAVILGQATYEEATTTGAAVVAYHFGESQPRELIPADASSVGPVAAADYDADGALDLFVGGRLRPGRYPAPASSRLYRRQGGKLLADEANSTLLKEVGLVSGATWSDLDGDGYAELILACEWGPVRVFHNTKGRLEEKTRALGLAEFTGWWNGVAAGDLDGDGRLDIIAANWGGNTKQERFRQHPLRIYYGDLAQDGTVQPLESCFDPGMNQYVPLRMLDAVTRAVPSLASVYPTHQSWAGVGLDGLPGEIRERLRYLEAKWLETTVFLNRGDHFEAIPMPAEAQLAPAFAVCLADYDGDGNEDVFLSQNFFAVDAETSRFDAGRGLWLRGDGKGGLQCVSGRESGVMIYGEQRGAAVGDYDHDGRPDLVVGQNSAETKLFRNVRGRPGLRVRLAGPPGNPQGIGAQMRLRGGGKSGPVREVSGGSGYGSQESPVQVLGVAREASQVWVRWPGGRTVTVNVPTGAKEVTIDFNEGTSP
jgi:hypothetical protein